MKKIVLVVSTLFLLFALFGCEGSGNKVIYEITPAPSSGNTQNTPSAESGNTDVAPSSEAAAPEYSNSTVELELDKPETANGITVTLSLKSESPDELDSIVAIINDSAYKLADGEVVKAYLCGTKSGDTGIILCCMGWDECTTYTFVITDNAVEQNFKILGELIEAKDLKMSISSRVDMLGTWIGYRQYKIVDGFNVAVKNNPEIIIDNNDDTRFMTALCDIPAKDEKSGDDTFIIEGTDVILESTDGSSYAVLKDVKNGNLYRISVESDGYGGFDILSIGNESLCLSNIRYSG